MGVARRIDHPVSWHLVTEVVIIISLNYLVIIYYMRTSGDNLIQLL